MCGIAGYVGSREIADSALSGVLGLMGRRGPDAAGMFRDRNIAGNNVYLLHSRLNIIDFDDSANQPFSSGPKTIVFNGELYNYIEIRKSLETSGVAFKTRGDTEVLVEVLRCRGLAALEQCEGMWAFALYDKNDGTVTLSRDRFGEKPIFVYVDGSGVYFGSEVKFIVALMGKQLTVNKQQLTRYLINGYRSLYKGRDTFFEGVVEVPAATNLHISASGDLKEEKYWRPEFRPDESITYSDAVKRVKDALVRSVEIRLRADVPLAFCLSGGIDSNAVISIAKRELNYDVHGFTVISEDPRFDEREMVGHSVRELGIKYTPVNLTTSGFIPNLRTLVRQHDAPIYYVAYYPHWLLMRGVSDAGYRVVVSGTAADELFCGYYDHHLSYLKDISDDKALYLEALANWQKNVRPIIRNKFWQNPNLYIENPEFREHLYLDGDDFSEFLSAPWREEFEEQTYTNHSLLRNRTMNEIFHETTPGILHSDDLNAMYFSLENRSPFLDRKLFELCYSIPVRHLIKGGYTKSILRDAVRGIVPDVILNNYQKTGFNAPIYELLNVSDPEVFSFLMEDSPVFEIIRREKVKELISMTHLPTSKSKFLHAFVNAKIFLEEFS